MNNVSGNFSEPAAAARVGIADVIFFITQLVLSMFYIFIVGIMYYYRKTIWKESFYLLIFALCAIDNSVTAFFIQWTISEFAGFYIYGITFHYILTVANTVLWHLLLAIQLWIALERFIAIVLFKKTINLFKPTFVKIVCLIGGFFVLEGIPMFIFYRSRFDFEHYYTAYEEFNWQVQLFLAIDQGYSYGVLALIFAFYAVIFLFSRKYFNVTATQETKMLQLKLLAQGFLLAVIILLYVILWNYIHDPVFLRVFALITYCGNPFLYLFMDRRLRHKCAHIVKKLLGHSQAVLPGAPAASKPTVAKKNNLTSTAK